jgi:hypothetical protein
MVDWFLPGWSVALAVTSASGDVVIPSGQSCLLLQNDGGVVCFVRWGSVVQVATSSDLPLLPGRGLVVAPGQATHVAAIAPGGLTVLRITGGSGRVANIIQGVVSAAASISPPLDSIAPAVAAYSLRRLRSAYAGQAVNVRRSSDNAVSDVGFAGNDFNVAGYNAFVGGGSGFIATWYDQTGNGHHATQATLANQPGVSLSVTSTGRSAVTGLAITSSLAAVVPASVLPLTLAAVTQRTGSFGTYGIPLSLGNFNPGIFYQNSANGGLGVANLNSAIGATLVVGDAPFHSTIALKLAGGGSTVVVDGVSNSAGLADVTGLTGLYVFDVGVSTGLVGNVCEAVYFSSALSGGDQATLYANQKAYYGTP